MEILSFLLCSIFYCSLLFKQFLMMKKGIKANLLVKSQGKNKKIMITEIFVSIGTYGMAVVQFISSSFFIHLKHFNFPWYIKVFGILLEIIGIFLLIKAMIDMQNSWRQGISLKQKTELITNGIYSFSRNPAFLGFDVFYIGNVLQIPTYIQLFFTFLSIISLHFLILCEEESLPAIFGDEYIEYQKKTPRYF